MCIESTGSIILSIYIYTKELYIHVLVPPICECIIYRALIASVNGRNYLAFMSYLDLDTACEWVGETLQK